MPRDVWETGKPFKPYTAPTGPVSFTASPSSYGGSAGVGPAGMTGSEAAGAGIMSQAEASQAAAQQSYQDTQNIANQLAAGYTPEQIQSGAPTVIQHPTTGELSGIFGGELPEPPKGTGIEVIPKKIIDKTKETVSDLYKNYIQGKPIRTLTPKEIKMLMQGLGRYDPVEGFQASGASVYGALLNAIFGKEQKYRMDKEGNYIYDEDLPDEYEDKRMFTKEGIIDFMRSIDPESNILGSIKKDMPGIYYDVMGMPQTTGDLEDLAGMAATDTTGMDRDSKEYRDAAKLNQQIFDAREEVDRQKYDQGIGDVGGGAGIMGAVPTPFTDVNNNGILDSLEVAQATTVPAATTPATTTTAAATTPTPFDYSELGPHFGPQYPGHYANWGPNYVNRGLGQGPNFDYFTQVANAFPGMRNYG